MALDTAVLYARGTGAAGEQPNPVVAQYQKTAIDGAASTAIHGLDTSRQVTLGGPVLTILGTTPPGKAGITLTRSVIQNSTDLVCNSNPLGNTLASSNRPTTLGDPIVNPAQSEAAGLSLSPETE